MTTFDEDVQVQAEVLARLMATWGSRRGEVRERLSALPDDVPIYLTGMGASFAAVSIAAPVLREAGRTVTVLDSGELGLYGAGGIPRGSLVIAASQTGRSRETVATAAALRGRGITVVGLINDTDSPLAEVVDLAIAIEAGPEASNASKTFTATQLLAMCVAGELTRRQPLEEFADLPGAVTRLSGTPDLIDGALALLGDSPYIAFLAHGPAMSTARYGALLSKEMLAVPGEAVTISEFRHGPVELVARTIGAVVIAPAGPGRTIAIELAASIAERGASVWLLATRGDDLPRVRGLTVTDLGSLGETEGAIAAAVPIQRLLSSCTRRLGRSPGVFTVFDPLIDTGRRTTQGQVRRPRLVRNR